MKDINEGHRGTGAQGKVQGKGVELPSPLAPSARAVLQETVCAAVRKLSRHCSFGFSWKLDYTGMTDEIFGH